MNDPKYKNVIDHAIQETIDISQKIIKEFLMDDKKTDVVVHAFALTSPESEATCIIAGRANTIPPDDVAKRIYNNLGARAIQDANGVPMAVATMTVEVEHNKIKTYVRCYDGEAHVFLLNKKSFMEDNPPYALLSIPESLLVKEDIGVLDTMEAFFVDNDDSEKDSNRDQVNPIHLLSAFMSKEESDQILLTLPVAVYDDFDLKYRRN